MPNNQRNEQPTNKLDPAETPKLADWLVGWLDWWALDYLAAWLVGLLLGCLVGGWLAGWLVCNTHLAMKTSDLPSSNSIVVDTLVELWYSGSMLLTNWLLSAFLVASPLAAVANEVEVQTEDPVLSAVPVAVEVPCKFAVNGKPPSHRWGKL